MVAFVLALEFFGIACRDSNREPPPQIVRPSELRDYGLSVSFQFLKRQSWYESPRIFGALANNSSVTYSRIWLILNLYDNDNAVVRKEWISLDFVSPGEKRRIDYKMHYDATVQAVELSEVRLIR